MNGICFQDTIRPNPDEPVLAVINYATEEYDEKKLIRYDIPNSPLRNNLFYLK